MTTHMQLSQGHLQRSSAARMLPEATPLVQAKSLVTKSKGIAGGY